MRTAALRKGQLQIPAMGYPTLRKTGEGWATRQDFSSFSPLCALFSGSTLRHKI